MRILQICADQLRLDEKIRLAQFLHIAFVVMTSTFANKPMMYFKIMDDQFQGTITVLQFSLILQ